LIALTTPSGLAGVPADRAVQLLGWDVDTIAWTVAGDPTGFAAVVARPGRWATPADFVGDALADLERVAADLLPAWLPNARIDRPDLGGLAAIRLAASAHARRADYAPALLMDLAVLAVTGRRENENGRPLPFPVRGAQLARLIAEGFRRFQSVLLVPLAADLTPAEQDAIVAGAGWLAHNAKLAVWLVGATPLSGDQVPLVRLTGPPPQPAPPPGRPDPAGPVEAALEGALATESWAAGRRWNQPYQSSPLSAPIRLDLLWLPERCIVEIDGPEHCQPRNFEADRQRDLRLQLDGFAVLRFTNTRIIHDVGAVVHQIGAYLHTRRRADP
jgi:uncharacterized protein DUF559